MNSQSKRGKQPPKQNKKKSQAIMRSTKTQSTPARALPSTETRSGRTSVFTYGTPSDTKTERVLTIQGNTSGTQYLNPVTVNPDGSPASTTSSFFLPINPGNRLLFTQLSNTAINFNKFRFTSLKIHYLENASGYATGNQTGNVICAFNPDAMDPFQDNTVALSALHHVQGSSWTKKTLVIPKEKLGGWRYVESSGLPPGADVHSYHVGTIQGGSFLQTTAVIPVGFVEVEYSCELDEPLNRQLVLGANTAAPTYQSIGLHQITTQSGIASGTGSFVDGNNWAISTKNSQAGFTKPTAAGSTFLNVPEGNWMIHGNLYLIVANANDFFTAILVTIQIAGGTTEAVYQWQSPLNTASYSSGGVRIQVPILYHISVAPNTGLQNLNSMTITVQCSTSLANTWSIAGAADGSAAASRSYLCISPMA